MSVLQQELELENELLRRQARRNFSAFVGYTNHRYNFNWHHKVIASKLQDFADGKIKRLMILAPPRHGKQISHDTPIFTPNGWRLHGNLMPGDFVYSPNGKPVKILAISEEAYQDKSITFSTGETIKCHDNHEWVIYDRHRKRHRIVESKEIHRRTKSIGVKGKRGHRYHMQVDKIQPLEGFKTMLPIDPYVLGVWLGDGTTSKNCITYSEKDKCVIEKCIEKGYHPTTHNTHEITGVHTDYFKRLYAELVDRKLLGYKHIPPAYFTAPLEDRKELLAGLIDTDGYVEKGKKRVRFVTCSERLRDDVIMLVRTMGAVAYYTAQKPIMSTSGIQGKSEIYQVCFHLDFSVPVAIERKQTGGAYKVRRIAITESNVTEPCLGRCIQVEGGVYVVGKTFIPTHNSELTSRAFPAFAFGQNPDLRIIACSYSADLASDMNADVQRYMTSPEYAEVFPDTTLNKKNAVSILQPKRNSTRFDIVNRSGYYISTGVGGPITGKGADRGIIDDPVKNKEEAFSPVFREKVWQWYTSTFYTRLEGDAGICIIMTPWHEDDLAGRLLKQMKDDPEADQWEVVRLPAIKDNEDNHYDPRQPGEALWPAKYSLNDLSRIRTIIQSHFTALYQLRPSAEEGNIIKKEWFPRYDPAAVRPSVVNFYIDTAYTDNKKNDRTAILAYFVNGRQMYVRSCRAVWKDFPDLIKFLKSYVVENGYTGASRIYIEPKASGKSVAQQLKAETNLNIIEDKPPTDSKEVRVRARTPVMESGRVLLPEDALWVPDFLNELSTFPNAAHDDQVDALIGAINKAFKSNDNSMSGLSYDDL